MNLPSTIRIGVAGFAHGHANAYCNSIQECEDAHLVAAWDHHQERGQNAAQRFGMEYEQNLEAFMSRSDIDAVIVTCETNRHADVIEAACAMGKHVLCQKPMATTLEDCDRIIRAVDQSGIHFQMAFQMRCDPLNQKIKEWVESGAVGKIGALRRRHCINFLFTPPDPGSAWHIDPIANIGMFFDDAVHAADFLLWIMGRPHSVMAEIDNTLTDYAPDDTGIAVYRWQGGQHDRAMGVLFNSAVTLAGENTCEIYGDQGVIIQNYDDGVSTGHAPPNAAALKLFRRESGQWEQFQFEIPAHHGARIAAVPRPWLDVLRAGKPPTVGAHEGKISVEMCLAAYQSAREGRRVLLDELQ